MYSWLRSRLLPAGSWSDTIDDRPCWRLLNDSHSYKRWNRTVVLSCWCAVPIPAELFANSSGLVSIGQKGKISPTIEGQWAQLCSSEWTSWRGKLWVEKTPITGHKTDWFIVSTCIVKPFCYFQILYSTLYCPRQSLSEKRQWRDNCVAGRASRDRHRNDMHRNLLWGKKGLEKYISVWDSCWMNSTLRRRIEPKRRVPTLLDIPLVVKRTLRDPCNVIPHSRRSFPNQPTIIPSCCVHSFVYCVSLQCRSSQVLFTLCFW